MSARRSLRGPWALVRGRALALGACLGLLGFGAGRARAVPEDPPGPPAPAPAQRPADGAPAPTPGLLGPREGPERAKALAAGGGTAATERAVAAALAWLARHAGEEGLWDADGFDAHCAAGGPRCPGRGKGQHGEEQPCPFDEALSGLCALAFLGAGHRPGLAQDPHGALLERLLARLQQVQETWALPLAVEALGEAEALERRGRFLPSLRALTARLLAARQPDGAWGYAAPWRPGSDVPFTGLVVPALLAAREAGLAPPPDLGPAVDRWLTTLEADRGRLAYLLDGRRYGYTPTTHNAHVAVLLRELLQAGTGGERHRAHVALVLADKPVWKLSFKTLDVPGRGKVEVQVGNLSLLAWWQAGVGLFQRGPAAFGGWFAAAKSALLPHQRADGCARGSWDPQGTYERQTGGRVLATALGALILEQPYRHRPLRAP